MPVDKKISQSIILSFLVTLLLSGGYALWYWIQSIKNNTEITQIYSNEFLTVDFYSLFISIFLTMFITIFMYKNDKEDAKEQNYQLEIIKDGTRNHINNFPEIFAKSLKLLNQISREQHYENFIYVNFFLNFGAVHAIFKKNQDEYKNIALNLGLDKLNTNTQFDLTNLEDAILYFNEVLWKILENSNKSIFLLAGDTNLDLNKSTHYYNKTYEISKIIIKIILTKNDKRIKDLYYSRAEINREEEKIDYINKIEGGKFLYKDRNLPFIMRIVFYELKKQKLTIKHLSNICKLFNINTNSLQDTKKLRKLLTKDIKTEEDKEKINKLKSEQFCILEAIYFLLKEVKVNNNEKRIKEQSKQLSVYIQYSKKINQLLEQEFYQRKKLREKISNGEIDATKSEVYFLKKEHFPHQGIVGSFTRDNETKKASLIFFISGDTTGSQPKGYYSELNDMHKLHSGAFNDIVTNFFKKE